ncbi:MAG: 3-hydroxyacyl-CoA dehydrogenase family protein, partial [Blastocatellia bacterium]
MVQTIGVVGAGTMGNGIAQVASRSGCTVLLQDVKEEFLERGLNTINGSLNRDVDKGRLSEEQKKEIISRIRPTTNLADLKPADLVIEAITEDLAVKSEVFRTLDGVARPDAILASNTSSISITRLAGVTSRPDRFIGMHFMNPVPVMKLVEIIRGAATSDDTYETTRLLAESMGKVPVEVN